MAAHSVNILLELIEEVRYGQFPEERKEELTERYLCALGYAPGMDELSSEDWAALENTLKSGAEVRELAITILGTQIASWIVLGKPRCHEDWARAKYG